MHQTLNGIWYERHALSAILVPAAWLFCAGVRVRRLAYQAGAAKIHRVQLPVIVVGNIAVGGTGKTPLVIWICSYLRSQGFRPGIVARGHKGNAARWPQQVRADSDAEAVGDEAIVLARRSACPVAVGRRRVEVVEALIQHTECDVVVCDDGMQHLALGRDVEIAVVDGQRGFGNGRCLPAGPLREPPSSLKRVDLVVSYGRGRKGAYSMQYRALAPRRLLDDRKEPVTGFDGEPIHAVAGIGNPLRFFSQLRGLGLRVIEHPFPDHHRYRPADLDFGDELPVMMTEKDAVKCQRFARPNHWYLPVSAELPAQFGLRLLTLIRERTHGQEAA